MMIDDLRATLTRVSCSAIVDAVGKRYPHSAHVLDLTSPTPGRVLFGPAATIRFFPVRRDFQHAVENDFAACFYRAIGDDGKGKVLVMSNGGYPAAALAGSRKLFRLNHTGLAGVLADGRLRDFADLAEYEFATYCRGETVRQGGPWVMPLDVNVPVEIGGVGVFPGDWIYADGSGAVVIPPADVRAVLQDAIAGEERDAASKARMKTEDPAKIVAEGEPR